MLKGELSTEKADRVVKMAHYFAHFISDEQLTAAEIQPLLLPYRDCPLRTIQQVEEFVAAKLALRIPTAASHP
jgi:hypothetical protein